jgi:hypothetical protein
MNSTLYDQNSLTDIMIMPEVISTTNINQPLTIRGDMNLILDENYRLSNPDDLSITPTRIQTTFFKSFY